MSAPERYGRRKVSKMLAEWNALRDAVRSGDPDGTQDAFDACEEWIDFALAPRTDTILSDPRVKALVEAVAELLDGDNWRLGRKFDPNSGNFDLSKQRASLAALKGAANE